MCSGLCVFLTAKAQRTQSFYVEKDKDLRFTVVVRSGYLASCSLVFKIKMIFFAILAPLR